jgi:DNA-binding NarL/FixJ family response regulator
VSGRRILVLEDDVTVARALQRHAGRFGDAFVAELVADARRLLGSSESWAAFIFDVALPDGNGLDLLAEARSVYEATPALVLTAFIDGMVCNRAYDLKARPLSKPWEPGRIEQFLSEATAAPARVEAGLQACARQHHIPDAEMDVLRRFVLGGSRDEIARARGTSVRTVGKQVETLLWRTGALSLNALARQILLEAS